MKTLRSAAKWLEKVGLAALLPGPETVLPTVWEAVAGTREVDWATRRDDGKLTFTPEMDRCWRWKDELPANGLALVGKHFGSWAALVAPRLVSHVWTAAAARRGALSEFHLHVADVVREHGACTGPQLRALCGAEKKHVEQLQRALVLTNSHLVEQTQGWPAIAVDLVDRLWEVTEVQDAEAELARTVLATADELSAADLGGALGWRLKRARLALDMVAEPTRRDGDVQLYSLV